MNGTWQYQWLGQLPDLYTIVPTRAGIHHIKLSPDQSLVLYPAKDGGIILRDINQDKGIWSDRTFYNPNGEEIAWSPDSKMVATMNMLVSPENRHLLLISSKGDVKEIVNAIYPQPEFYPYNFSWSPDSRYLAYVDNNDGKNNLYIYDTQTNGYLYRCPLSGITNAPRIFWSPDNEWIVFGDELEGNMQILVVPNGQVIDLLKGALPVGWSDKFPVNWPSK